MIWTWIKGNQILTGLMALGLAFLGWKKVQTAHDNRIRKERDQHWRVKIMEGENETEDKIKDAVLTTRDIIESDGLHNVAARDRDNRGAVRRD